MHFLDAYQIVFDGYRLNPKPSKQICFLMPINFLLMATVVICFRCLSINFDASPQVASTQQCRQAIARERLWLVLMKRLSPADRKKR